MGEWFVYYVPENEEPFYGKENEIADQFWDYGIFLATDDDHIIQRIAAWKQKSKPLLDWSYTFTFAEMGVTTETDYVIVPDTDDYICPHCYNDITEQVYNCITDDIAIPLKQRSIHCPSCGLTYLITKLTTKEAPFSFTRFYLWVSDIDLDDWDPSFRDLIERVLGPCKEYIGYTT